MPKPKAPRRLTESFATGVDEERRRQRGRGAMMVPLYGGHRIDCWLALHDPARRACSGPLERFHFVSRQRIENAMWEKLRGDVLLTRDDMWALILKAAWDPRNGGLGCEGHHRRYDGHRVTLPRDRLIVPRAALPPRVEAFAADWGLEHELDRKFS